MNLRSAVRRLFKKGQPREPFFAEPEAATWERSRTRWKEADPSAGLTWGLELTGDPFVDKLLQYGALGENKRLLEVGPGYGRLIGTLLRRDEPFASYLGVDIAPTNVAFLRGKLGSERVHFIQGDAETIALDAPFDTFYSSLTLKHFYPSFEKALANLSRFAAPGALLVFDLMEGDGAVFEADKITFIRWYTRPQVKKILRRIGFAVVAFDEVEHAPEFKRLLVVARKK